MKGIFYLYGVELSEKDEEVWKTGHLDDRYDILSVEEKTYLHVKSLSYKITDTVKSIWINPETLISAKENLPKLGIRAGIHIVVIR